MKGGAGWEEMKGQFGQRERLIQIVELAAIRSLSNYNINKKRQYVNREHKHAGCQREPVCGLFVQAAHSQLQGFHFRYRPVQV